MGLTIRQRTTSAVRPQWNVAPALVRGPVPRQPFVADGHPQVATEPTAASRQWPLSQGLPGWSAIAGLLGLTGLGYLLGRVAPGPSKAQPLEAQAGKGKSFDWATCLGTMLFALPPETSLAAELTGGYSPTSYYTALGLFFLALPGLYSLVTRSVKPKIVRKTYVLAGPNAGGLAMKEVARKILFYVTTKRGFEVKEAGKTITFRGKLARRQGQAAFLTFCMFLSLLSLGLVLQTIETASLGQGQGLGNWWYALSLASPLAGKYYLDNADTEQELQVKIVSDDDEKEIEVIVQGDDAEVEFLRIEFDWQEKGMVRVRGLFEEQLRAP